MDDPLVVRTSQTQNRGSDDVGFPILQRLHEWLETFRDPEPAQG
jgi:hypothetical protein